MSVWTVPSKNLNGLCVYDSPKSVLDGRSFNGSDKVTRQWCKAFCQGKESLFRRLRYSNHLFFMNYGRKSSFQISLKLTSITA